MVRKAIILAAGMGTRLKPLTLKTHKCLTEVNKSPILVNALEILDNCGFKQVTIVVGYLKQMIIERIGARYGAMEIIYAENDIYDKTNTSWSLKLGLEKTTDYDEVYILEGDVFFDKQLMEDLLCNKEKNITVLEPYNADLDGTFVELNKNGKVIDWTHKSHRYKGYCVEDKYKTVNIHRFSAEFEASVLSKYLQENLNITKGREPLENVMETLVRENPNLISGLILTGQKWFEIDELSDLEKAEKIWS